MLDTFLYADKQLMQSCPDLLRAKVYVHFQSDVQVRRAWQSGCTSCRSLFQQQSGQVHVSVQQFLCCFGCPYCAIWELYLVQRGWQIMMAM